MNECLHLGQKALDKKRIFRYSNIKRRKPVPEEKLLLYSKNHVISVSLIIVAVAIGLFGGFYLAGAAEGPEGAAFQVFRNPPVAGDLKMAMLDGRIGSLAGFMGKVVILNFWRNNCHYCAMEKGFLKEMLGTMNTNDIKVVCVDFWDPPAWVKSYGKSSGGGLIFASGPEGRQAVMENVVRGRLMGYYIVNAQNEAIYEIKGFPSSYVINKKGQVVAVHLGLAPWNSPPVRKWLAGLVGMKQPGKAHDSEYELPGWLDRLLTNPMSRSLSIGYGPSKTARAAVSH